MLSLFYGGSPPGSPLTDLPFNIGDLDDAFGAFNVLPGGQLINQQIGQYPFANQSVAANAVIREPLTLSVIMDAPMRDPALSGGGGNAWQQKLTTFTALKATLDAHNNKGGLYIVATPAYIYENLIMLNLTDNSRGNNSLPQNAWRFDFEKPLVSMSDITSALNQQMGFADAQVPWNGNLSQRTQAPAQSSQPQNQQTYPGLAGALIGGPPAFTQTQTTQNNYPALAPASTYAFSGIA